MEDKQYSTFYLCKYLEVLLTHSLREEKFDWILTLIVKIQYNMIKIENKPNIKR